MATSDGFGRRVLRYLESARNLVGCGGGAVGLGLHFAGLGGAWWPAVVAGLYGAGALLTPGPRTEPPVVLPVVLPGDPLLLPPTPGPRPEPEPEPAPRPDPELAALADYLATVPLPDSAGVAGLLAALRSAEPGPVPEGIVRHRLPVAVAGYLRALTWRPWAGPDAPDPEAELGREVRLLVADLA
ncbi:hypothetical protein [Kitasatospora sp. NBC_01300]|uniref:hypothetical protein n=1 Tax=Kitasatospora sp. NBC_01300 TaxID=2903574 RepID=UPI00352DDE88|nr:hypothetical protein OG556_08435 [Kitasatospora sp. NBC_01300]